MEDENIMIYFVGTAGSGKSTLTYAFQKWLNQQSLDAITINLDPGAENLNYSPDIDIRDWLKLEDIMDEYGLGPNGAQIVCADMLALKIQDVKSILDDFKSHYVLVDTPGQIELFSFRKSSNVVVDTLGRNKSILSFLFDPFIGSTTNGFVSLVMLSATLQFRFNLPMINLLSKVDMLENNDLKRIQKWATNMDELFNESMEASENVSDHLNFELLKVMESMSLLKDVVPTSAETGEGLADIYTLCQQAFMASEDLSMD